MGFCLWRKGLVSRRRILQKESNFFFEIVSSPRSLVELVVALFEVLGPQEIVYLICQLPWKSLLYTFYNMRRAPNLAEMYLVSRILLIDCQTRYLVYWFRLTLQQLLSYWLRSVCVAGDGPAPCLRSLRRIIHQRSAAGLCACYVPTTAVTKRRICSFHKVDDFL
jgi:hypothetical protein